jgi:hypothetical protein
MFDFMSSAQTCGGELDGAAALGAVAGVASGLVSAVAFDDRRPFVGFTAFLAGSAFRFTGLELARDPRAKLTWEARCTRPSSAS